MRRIKHTWKNFSGGLNTKSSPYELQEGNKGQLAETQNVRITDDGNVQKRTGSKKVNAQIADTTSPTSYVTTIHQYKDYYGNKTNYTICGDKLYYDNNGTWTERSDYVGATKTFSYNKRASMFTWKNNLFGSNGEEPAWELGQQTLYTQKVMFVASRTNSEIIKYDLSGNILGRFGSAGTGNGQFTDINGMSIDTTNKRIYVIDFKRTQVFDYDGVFQFSIAKAGFGVLVDNTNGFVYIGGIGIPGESFYRYDLNGNLLVEKVSEGLASAENFALDLDSSPTRLYVTDTQNSTVLYYNADTLDYIGDTGISITTYEDKLYYDSTNNYLWNAQGNGYDTSFVKQVDLTITDSFSRGFTVLADGSNDNFYYSADDSTIKSRKIDDSSGTTVVTTEGRLLNVPEIIIVDIPTGVKADVFHDLGSPLALQIANDTAGTALTNGDTYQYRLTYVDTVAGVESSGGIESNQVVSNGKDMALTNIPAPPRSNELTSGSSEVATSIDKIYIYRRNVGDATYGNYIYVDDIDIGSDYTFGTSYTDSVADASLTVTDTVPTVNTLVPTFKYLVQYKDILFGAGDFNNPNYLYWTNSLDQNDWNNVQYVNLGTGGYYEPIGADEGTLITGLKVLGDYLTVFKENSIWYVNPSISKPDTVNNESIDLIGITMHTLTLEYGAVSGFSADYATISGRNGIIFADKDRGICFLTESGVIPLSENNVQNDWNTLSKLYTGNAYGQFFTKYFEYWLTLDTGTNGENDQVWCFDTRTLALYKPFEFTFGGAAQGIASMAIVDDNGTDKLYAGDYDGNIVEMDNGTSDDNTDGTPDNISAYMTTGWSNCRYPGERKVFDKVIISFINKAVGSFTLQWAVDGGAFNTGVSITMTASESRTKWTQKLPRTIGEHIRFKISEATTIGFEIIGIEVHARVRKTNIGGTQ
jgi:hypothetical protein